MHLLPARPRPAARGLRLAVAAALGALLLGLLAAPAGAGPAPLLGELPSDPGPAVASADALPTAQVDGVVYDAVVVGQTVWAVGDFNRSRPSGQAVGGPGEQATKGLVTFDVTTGELTGPVHSLTGQEFTSPTSPGAYCDTLGPDRYRCDTAFRVAASPDGSRVYVGGDFTAVDGQSRFRLAAFDAASGALVPGFRPAFDDRVRALSVTADAVYVGGAFRSVDGTARTRLAAVRPSDGSLLPWAPSADGTVIALAASPSADRVVLGGAFASVSGRVQQGLTAVRASGAGALAPWRTSPVPPGGSYVTDLEIRGDVVVGGANGEGRPQFDGRFVATVTTGDLRWLDDCRGATQAVAVLGDVVYSANHAHRCDGLDAFGERRPLYQRLLAQTLDARRTNRYGDQVPQLLHWFPRTDDGPANSPFRNGTWAVATDEARGYVVVGGEFLSVNDVPQQGLTRFRLRADSPRASGPVTPVPAPQALSVAPGEVRVSFPAAVDRDDASLTYTVLRDGTPVETVTRVSAPYLTPSVTVTDRGLTPGDRHVYRYRVVDPDGNLVGSPSAAAVTVSGGAPLPPVAATAVDDGAESVWRLSEPAGAGDAADLVGRTPLRPSGGVTFGVPSPAGIDGTAVRLDGTGSLGALEQREAPGPQLFTAEAWVRTTPGDGGQVVGFGTARSGASSGHDRTLHVRDDGRPAVGVQPDDALVDPDPRFVVTGPDRVDDGRWHHLAASVSPAGLTLYVDGRSVGVEPATTALVIPGYWRVGADDMSEWPGVSGEGVRGDVALVAVHGRALSEAEVAARVAAADAASPLQPSFTVVCAGLRCTVDASASEPRSASVTVDLGDGTVRTGRLVEHTYDGRGRPTVSVVLTGADGASSTESRTITFGPQRRVRYAP